MKLSAFILAAGIGERLLPITRHIPKPLLPLVGKPILELVLKRITAIPINNIGINLHHKKHLIENWVQQSEYVENITLFHEDPILGTGGALKNAEGFLKKSPFLVHNSDILSEIDLGKLIESHISSGNIATLAVHNHPEFNRLEVDMSGLLTGFISCKKWLIDGWKPVAFTGIAVYQPDFLQFLPEGNSSVVDGWFHAMSAGHRIGTMDVTGCYWTDVGTPSSYAQAVIHAMRENGETVYIHPSVECCMNTELDGYVVLEKGTILSKGITLRNSISLPDTSIGKTSSDDSSSECFLTLFWGTPDDTTAKRFFENSILGPDFIVQLSQSDFYETDNNGNTVIGIGGSDKIYYRVKKNHRSAVLMQCTENDPDFHRHIEYTAFLRKYSIPVPELIDLDIHKKTALFEDLGDLSLYSWLKCSRPGHQVEDMYRRVLDTLIPMHTTATAHVHECPLLQNRIFDYEYLRWETGYFLERFVQGIKHIDVNDRKTLESEFHTLATMVDSFPKAIIHRDFQSQNIMITKDGIPRILDYQGARMAPPAYDIASLLWDPYCRIEGSLRERLLEYYICKVNHQTPAWREFRGTILPCRLQRHMQALGAYGFLSTVKGKKYFQKYIPEGIGLLQEDMIGCGNDYPVLHKLVMQL
jgi:NDP-sugar pyrophosphorylase family protein/aminoglycoside/choline kinase family phosphotransferase